MRTVHRARLSGSPSTFLRWTPSTPSSSPRVARLTTSAKRACWWTMTWRTSGSGARVDTKRSTSKPRARRCGSDTRSDITRLYIIPLPKDVQSGKPSQARERLSARLIRANNRGKKKSLQKMCRKGLTADPVCAILIPSREGGKSDA